MEGVKSGPQNNLMIGFDMKIIPVAIGRHKQKIRLIALSAKVLKSFSCLLLIMLENLGRRTIPNDETNPMTAFVTRVAAV